VLPLRAARLTPQALNAGSSVNIWQVPMWRHAFPEDLHEDAGGSLQRRPLHLHLFRHRDDGAPTKAVYVILALMLLMTPVVTVFVLARRAEGDGAPAQQWGATSCCWRSSAGRSWTSTPIRATRGSSSSSS